MQVVVLAAGRGTRMRPLTDRRPKPLLPVGDRPLVVRGLDAAAAAGADRAVVVVGYEADAVREAIGAERAGLPVEYVTQERQRGTADAVRAAVAADALDPGPFAVLNGDVLVDPDSLRALFADGPAVAAARVDRPGEYGVLDVDDGTLAGVTEKPAEPASNLINAGSYLLPDAARDLLDVPESERGEAELTDVLDRVRAERPVRVVEFDRWLDVGYPWDLLRATELVLADRDRRIEGEVSPDADLRGSVVVEPGATVRAGVTVEGPVLIRAGATVGPNAYVRGATVLGPDAHVGHAVEVKNSVLMRGATAGHLSYVGDSVLGRAVNLGAGTTVANLRHDGADVRATATDERRSTGRRKFGVVCGDEVRTGIDTALNAGVTLSTGATTAPGETVLEDR
jgi:bifunctional UDP-N-acetylglucosamine pyrophosphorylase/glucosamine-1-phosphate N-acetyltransferase